MTSLRRLIPFTRSASLVLAACSLPLTAGAEVTVDKILAQQPRQKNVEYDRPTPAEAKQATLATEKQDGANAYVVRDAGGMLLRRFADTNDDRLIDRLSYYRDGLEVYRDIDTNGDGKVDQARWLNSAGSRWGVDANGDGVIDAWKAISAEEASAEIVSALRDRDAVAFQRLLPTKEELGAAGFTGDTLAELVKRTTAAGEAFAKLAAGQKEVGDDARWTSMLTPQPPGTIPAGSGDVDRDVTAYDNVVALFEGKAGNGQVFIGSLLRCGDAWRPVDAPLLSGEARAGDVAGFFTPRPGAGAAATGEVDENLKPLLTRLRDIETKMAAAAPAARPPLAAEQVAVLEQTLAAASPTDRGFWMNQLVETLAAHVQEGVLPEGMDKLQKLADAAGDDQATAAFVGFRLIQARYSAGMMQPGADGEKLQKAWFDELQKFVAAHPRAPESAEAMLQLAFRDEFEGRDKDAVTLYREVAASFPTTPQARKAAGAVRRLESVGKPLALAGTGLDGKQVSVASFKGVPVLVHYWSTDCEPCKVDLAQIRELQAKYGPRKLVVIGVALDGERGKLAKFLQAKPLPWPQLHEPGGLDSRLAEELGILALPTMMLVGPDGTVVDRNVSITGLEKRLDELIAETVK